MQRCSASNDRLPTLGLSRYRGLVNHKSQLIPLEDVAILRLVGIDARVIVVNSEAAELPNGHRAVRVSGPEPLVRAISHGDPEPVEYPDERKKFARQLTLGQVDRADAWQAFLEGDSAKPTLPHNGRFVRTPEFRWRSGSVDEPPKGLPLLVVEVPPDVEMHHAGILHLVYRRPTHGPARFDVGPDEWLEFDRDPKAETTKSTLESTEIAEYVLRMMEESTHESVGDPQEDAAIKWLEEIGFVWHETLLPSTPMDVQEIVRRYDQDSQHDENRRPPAHRITLSRFGRVRYGGGSWTKGEVLTACTDIEPTSLLARSTTKDSPTRFNLGVKDSLVVVPTQEPTPTPHWDRYGHHHPFKPPIMDSRPYSHPPDAFYLPDARHDARVHELTREFVALPHRPLRESTTACVGRDVPTGPADDTFPGL